MTDAPRATPLRFDAIDDVLAAMRSSGHRVSTTCRLVLDALFAVEGPVSAQFIAGGREGRAVTLELTSVYRNLERLEELGVVQHVHLGHGPGLYMLVGAGEKEFLVCERCDRVRTVDPGELDRIRAEIEARFGYRARFGHFPIVGLCSSCSASDRSGPSDTVAEHAQQHSHGDYVHAHSHDEPHRH
jgi:Fur family ferric uptake transcriptional regulator